MEKIAKEEHIFQHILQFISSPLRSFVLRTCKEWNKNIRESKEYYLSRANKQALYAAEHGYLNILKLLHSEYGNNIWTDNIMYKAAQGGHLDIIKYGRENGCPWSNYTCGKAAAGGHFEIVKYANENGCPWHPSSSWDAFVYGDWDLIQYIVNHGGEWPEDPLYAAVWNQHMHLVIKLLEMEGMIRSDRSYYLNTAAKTGNLEIFKYLEDREFSWLDDSVEAAARSGKLEMLKHLVEQLKEDGEEAVADVLDERVATAAALSGNVECLKYLHQHGCKWNEKTCERAASQGYLECLKYARENGCPWDEETCNEAAGEAQLECLKYAIENGCDWNKDTIYQYAVAGLNVMKCVLDHGAHMGPDVCGMAARAGHYDLVKYLVDVRKCELNEETFEMAASRGHPDIIKYLHENGCPWDASACANAATNLEVLTYLHENGCPWDDRACKKAADYVDSECLDYIMTHGGPIDLEYCREQYENDGEPKNLIFFNEFEKRYLAMQEKK